MAQKGHRIITNFEAEHPGITIGKPGKRRYRAGNGEQGLNVVGAPQIVIFVVFPAPWALTTVVFIGLKADILAPVAVFASHLPPPLGTLIGHIVTHGSRSI